MPIITHVESSGDLFSGTFAKSAGQHRLQISQANLTLTEGRNLPKICAKRLALFQFEVELTRGLSTSIMKIRVESSGNLFFGTFAGSARRRHAARAHRDVASCIRERVINSRPRIFNGVFGGVPTCGDSDGLRTRAPRHSPVREERSDAKDVGKIDSPSLRGARSILVP